MPETKEVLLNKLHKYSVKHKTNPKAGEILMSFFRGECEHLFDAKGKCELCDVAKRRY
jgi:hypothetical protein